jgi:hypothetical protein
MFHQGGGTPPEGQALQAQAITDGSIPSAMQWKKATVLAVTVPQDEAFTGFLSGLEMNADQVHTFAGEPQAGVTPHLYALYGWSNSGRDELRQATLDSVLARGATIDVYVTRPQVQMPNSVMGTADMKFIGWEAPLPDLEDGEYTARLMVSRPVLVFSERGERETTQAADYEKAAEVKFQVPDDD